MRATIAAFVSLIAASASAQAQAQAQRQADAAAMDLAKKTQMPGNIRWAADRMHGT
jgi:hypothetical protein